MPAWQARKTRGEDFTSPLQYWQEERGHEMYYTPYLGALLYREQRQRLPISIVTDHMAMLHKVELSSAS